MLVSYVQLTGVPDEPAACSTQAASQAGNQQVQCKR